MARDLEDRLDGAMRVGDAQDRIKASWASAPVLAAIGACEKPFVACGEGCILSAGHDADHLFESDLMPDCQGGTHQPFCRHHGKATPSPRPVVAALLRDVAAGIRVLRMYGVDITEEQVMERARGIVMGLIGNFRIEEETP